MSPDDRNAGSTSKAQPSCCTGEVSEGQAADPVIYGSLQSNCLVFIVLLFLSPQRSGGRKSEDTARRGTRCCPLVLRAPLRHGWENVAMVAWRDPLAPPYLCGQLLPAGTALTPAMAQPQGGGGQRSRPGGVTAAPWRGCWGRWGAWGWAARSPWRGGEGASLCRRNRGGKAPGVQQPLKTCRQEEQEVQGAGPSCRHVF